MYKIFPIDSASLAGIANDRAGKPIYQVIGPGGVVFYTFNWSAAVTLIRTLNKESTA